MRAGSATRPPVRTDRRGRRSGLPRVRRRRVRHGRLPTRLFCGRGLGRPRRQTSRPEEIDMTRPTRPAPLRAVDAGHEREDDGEGRRQRRRPGVPRSRGRRRAHREGASPASRDRRPPSPPRLGRQDPRRADQRRRTPCGATTISSRSSPEPAPPLDVVIIPKVKAPRDVWFVDTLLAQLETKLGLYRAGSASSPHRGDRGPGSGRGARRRCPRLEALILGVGDLSASQGIRPGHIGDSAERYPGDMWHSPGTA